ncbi:MAG TPA: YceI family protein [Thermoanaerobaculia bacterium]
MAAVALPTPASSETAKTYVIDKTHSDVSFQVRHLVTKVRGRFADFDAEIRAVPEAPEESSVRFAIRTASVDTDLPDRDQHLRSADFFDADEHPEITFVSSRIRSAGDDRYDVTGLLTLRGVAREMTLPVSFLGFVSDPWGNEKAGFETEVVLNRKDFGMVWNAALDNGGVVLGDKVTVSISLEAVRARDAAAA